MKKFGLIGHPIADSLSPRLFAAAYAGKYPYDLIEGADFESAYRRFLEEYQAINITAPFKEDAFAQALALTRDGLGSLSGSCFKIGATNLMVKTPEGIQAHNSDFSGIILSVAEALFPGLVESCYAAYGERGHIKVHQYLREEVPAHYPLQPQALVVGCGGAGKAAAVAAAEMGYSTVLMNRTRERAQAIADALPEYAFLVDDIQDFPEAVRECDLVIYTLPVALPQIATLTAQQLRGEGTKVILEANYKTPAFDAQQVQAAGAHYVAGKEWLRYQALTGYSLMTGEIPDRAALEAAI